MQLCSRSEEAMGSHRDRNKRTQMRDELAASALTNIGERGLITERKSFGGHYHANK